ncbi:unnamed protein product [Closterium sp. Yama58-4]|nr:unnamed protein product [Closterium sp. Yama58-4]
MQFVSSPSFLPFLALSVRPPYSSLWLLPHFLLPYISGSVLRPCASDSFLVLRGLEPSMARTCEEDGAVNGLLMAFVLRSSSLFMELASKVVETSLGQKGELLKRQEALETKVTAIITELEATRKRVGEAEGRGAVLSNELRGQVEELVGVKADLEDHKNRALALEETLAHNESSAHPFVSLPLHELTTARGELAAVKNELGQLKCGVEKIWEAIFSATPARTSLDAKNISCLSDAALGRISTMQHLQSIGLDGSSGFTAEGIKQLYRLPQLRGLDMRNTPISDDALHGIGVLSSTLHILSLVGTTVTDAALHHVAALSSLTLLDLVGCRGVTSAGMVHVGKLGHLEDLHLGSTGVKDDGLRHLLSLTKLKILAVPPGVTDAGMELVAQLSELERLDLWDSTVTQKGVGKLMGLPHLMRIRTYVSALDVLITRGKKTDVIRLSHRAPSSTRSSHLAARVLCDAESASSRASPPVVAPPLAAPPVPSSRLPSFLEAFPRRASARLAAPPFASSSLRSPRRASARLAAPPLASPCRRSPRRASARLAAPPPASPRLRSPPRASAHLAAPPPAISAPAPSSRCPSSRLHSRFPSPTCPSLALASLPFHSPPPDFPNFKPLLFLISPFASPHFPSFFLSFTPLLPLITPPASPHSPLSFPSFPSLLLLISLPCFPSFPSLLPLISLPCFSSFPSPASPHFPPCFPSFPSLLLLISLPASPHFPPCFPSFPSLLPLISLPASPHFPPLLLLISLPCFPSFPSLLPLISLPCFPSFPSPASPHFPPLLPLISLPASPHFPPCFPSFPSPASPHFPPLLPLISLPCFPSFPSPVSPHLPPCFPSFPSPASPHFPPGRATTRMRGDDVKGG